MSIFPPPVTRDKSMDPRVRVEVYDSIVRIAAGRKAEREMREMLAKRGLNPSELTLFVNAIAEETTNG